jgi:hypothetical protein
MEQLETIPVLLETAAHHVSQRAEQEAYRQELVG